MSRMYPCTDLLGLVGSITKQYDIHEIQGSMDGFVITGGNRCAIRLAIMNMFKCTVSAALEQQQQESGHSCRRQMSR